MDDDLRFDPREPAALVCYRASFLTDEVDQRPWRHNRPNADSILKSATELQALIRRRGGKS